MKIKVKVYGNTIKKVEVIDERCLNYKCFKPHNCPVQGAGGVRDSKERWVCLTNFYHGCPDNPQYIERSDK
jgi:hypothetical protein